MRKIILLLITSVIFAASVWGCGRRSQNNAAGNDTEIVNTQEQVSMGQMGTEAVLDTEHTSQLQLGSAVEIPESFKGQPSETEAHIQLEKAITEYCNVAEDDYANVRYYYNYVDLNGDSKNEILALVFGQGAEGIGENLLLWLDEAESENISAASVRQVFHRAGVPVYISNHMTQGYRDLIIANQMATADDMGKAEDVDASNAGRTIYGEPTSLQRTAGLDETTGENGAASVSMDQTYLLLTWKGDRYQELEEGTTLFSLEGYEGTAVLTNHIETDALTLTNQ